jgi:hypothetical protein
MIDGGPAKRRPELDPDEAARVGVDAGRGYLIQPADVLNVEPIADPNDVQLVRRIDADPDRVAGIVVRRRRIPDSGRPAPDALRMMPLTGSDRLNVPSFP